MDISYHLVYGIAAAAAYQALRSQSAASGLEVQDGGGQPRRLRRPRVADGCRAHDELRQPGVDVGPDEGAQAVGPDRHQLPRVDVRSAIREVCQLRRLRAATRA